MPVVNCPIDIPEGWEFVRYGVPKHGEYFMYRGGEPAPACHDFSTEWIVIRRARPAIEVGDWVRASKDGSTFYGVRGVIQKSRTDGDYLVQFGSRGAGWFCGDELIKQTRTIEPYTRDECIADAVKLGFPAVKYEGSEWVISAYDEFGIYVKQDNLERPFVLYGEAARKVTWPGGEAFGTVTWRDAE